MKVIAKYVFLKVGPKDKSPNDSAMDVKGA